jgi:predicted AlkP superfamily pyrophosphatase or phosphodiesterase
MKKLLLLFLLLSAAASAAENRVRPKLLVTIVIDQFRQDYLIHKDAGSTGGFARLLKDGAVFVDARFIHYPTITAIGHSTILSGATPSVSGIIGNDWYDRQAGKRVTSVSDEKEKMVGGSRSGGASPRRLLVDTLGDQLKIASGGKSRVFGISYKDRAAILPVGHMADAAYWFDVKSGEFVTSTYYRPDIPAWIPDFSRKAAAGCLGTEWLGHKIEEGTRGLSQIGATPCSNQLVEAFSERIISGEKLGKNADTDLISISFSGVDYAGHQYGPDSTEVRGMVQDLDKQLDRLFAFLDRELGMKQVMVVLTSDHGVAPVPEVNAARKMPGGRTQIQEALGKALNERFGDGKWILASGENSFYLNYELIREKKLNRSDVANAAKEIIQSMPHVFRVYTGEQLENGDVLPDLVGRLVMNGYHVGRGPDLTVVLDPYWIFSQTGTAHGTPFSYDTHVPVVFMGPGILPGTYYQAIAVNDIAPTLAGFLGVETPAGSSGRILSEIFDNRPAPAAKHK